MALLDTIDGALMMALYTSTTLAVDRIAILYYSIVLTSITVLVAFIIGIIQLLNLILNVTFSDDDDESSHGKFWAGVEKLGEKWDVVGGAVCGLFVVGGVVSVLAYKPWRRRVERTRARDNGEIDRGD